MTSIQTHMVGSSGPYAYRVYGPDHPDAGSNDQHWEYLGPVGAVDPEELTQDEVAQLREEDFALARFRDIVEGDVYDRAVANNLRDELIDEYPDLGEDILSPDDDRRETVIRLSEDAPADAQEFVERQAADAESEAKSVIGQAGLTRDEISKIDFSRENANIPHAQAAKAAITEAGESDWIQAYEPETYPSPHANKEKVEGSKESTMQTGAPSPGDRRLDNDDEIASINVAEGEARWQQYLQDKLPEAADRYAESGGTDTDEEEFLTEVDDISQSDLDVIAEHGADAIEV